MRVKLDIARVTEMVRIGLSDEVIAIRCGCSARTLWKFRHRYGLTRSIEYEGVFATGALNTSGNRVTPRMGLDPNWTS
jgi:CO dehydrogenase/acetyl-CoA synthase alpha subunit